MLKVNKLICYVYVLSVWKSNNYMRGFFATIIINIVQVFIVCKTCTEDTLSLHRYKVSDIKYKINNALAFLLFYNF